MDSGHHQVYMSLYFMGMPKKLHAFTSNLVLSGMEGEDISQVNLTYLHNTLGCIMQSWTSNFGDGINGIKLMGDKGQILITDALYFNGNKLTDDVDYARSFVHQANAFTDYVPMASSLSPHWRMFEIRCGLFLAHTKAAKKILSLHSKRPLKPQDQNGLTEEKTKIVKGNSRSPIVLPAYAGISL